MVVYLVCFDLGATMEVQMEQVKFLDSSLFSSSTPQKDGKWVIFIVGLRSDLRKGDAMFKQNHLDSWMNLWPHLPIFNQIFMVSSITALQGAHDLFRVIQKECDRIFESHTTLVPVQYKKVLEYLQSIPDENCFITEAEVSKRFDKAKPALLYLHAIGRIVLFHNGMVCTNTSIASKIAAKFISPEEVRIQLLKDSASNV